MKEKLKKEFDYYLKNQDKLVKEYNEKFIVIKDCKVIGAYNSELDAIKETTKNHELGTFLVQRCEQGDASYTQAYHSRVIFT